MDTDNGDHRVTYPFRKTPLVDSLVASSPSQPSPKPTRGTAVLLTVGRRSGRCCGVRARTTVVHRPVKWIETPKKIT